MKSLYNTIDLSNAVCSKLEQYGVKINDDKYTNIMRVLTNAVDILPHKIISKCGVMNLDFIELVYGLLYDSDNLSISKSRYMNTYLSYIHCDTGCDVNILNRYRVQFLNFVESILLGDFVHIEIDESDLENYADIYTSMCEHSNIKLNITNECNDLKIYAGSHDYLVNTDQDNLIASFTNGYGFFEKIIFMFNGVSYKDGTLIVHTDNSDLIKLFNTLEIMNKAVSLISKYNNCTIYNSTSVVIELFSNRSVSLNRIVNQAYHGTCYEITEYLEKFSNTLAELECIKKELTNSNILNDWYGKI